MLMLLLILMPLVAEAQWQFFQLTNWPPVCHVVQCSALADSFGSVHCFVESDLNTSPGYTHRYLHYLRASFYGHILTDTVRLDTSTADYAGPSRPLAMGDGQHAWCVWGNLISMNPVTSGLFLAGRQANGEEYMPTTLVGTPGWSGGPTEDEHAALRTEDSTIHVVVGGYYSRITASGDTVVWWRHMNSVTIAVDPKIHIAPDGAPWAAVRNAWGTGQTEIVVVRFGEDTSQTVYRPFDGPVLHWGARNFGIDSSYQFHFLVSCDTSYLAYVRLDSAMQILEWQTLSEQYDSHSTITADASGNCLIVWEDSPDGNLKWAYRSADGTWPHPPSVIASDAESRNLSVVLMDSARFAFIGTFVDAAHFHQLGLYTYGFPPNAAAPDAPHAITTKVSVYPNPFTSQLHIEVLNRQIREIDLYDIFGRLVWSRSVAAGATQISASDPYFSALPSGTYILTLEAIQPIAPIQVIHLK